MNIKQDEMRIAIVGDSIAEGLGVKGISYGDLLCAQIEKSGRSVNLLNLAHTGYQISDSIKLLPQVTAFAPDLVIIAHGITESVIRPVPSSLRLVPKRWRQIGWLDPRPYFSRRLWKYIYHKMESEIRWRFKNKLIKKYGGYTLTAAEDFEMMLVETVEAILNQTTACVVLLTHNGIDERFYPGSLYSMNHYQHSIERVVTDCRTDRVRLCDVSHLLTEWSDFFADHFHPNAAGHARIAQAIFETLLVDDSARLVKLRV